MIRLYRKKNKNLIIKFALKYILCPHLKCRDYNDYTTLLSDLSPIDFIKTNLSIVLDDILKECRKWLP